MAIPWTEQTLRWFEVASDYTCFHQRLTEKLLPLMPKRATVVDLGCGAGLMDLALARHAGHITCVDQNEEVLRFLQVAAQARGIENLRVIHGDVMRLQAQWDTAVMLFFGSIATNIGQLLSLCHDRAIAIVRADKHGHLGPSAHHPLKHDTVSSIADAFEARGVRFDQMEDALEYGQPLADMEEARAFVRTYSRHIGEEALDAYLQEKLVHTGESEFPLYLPNLKRFGIFSINKSENAHITPREDAHFAATTWDRQG